MVNWKTCQIYVIKGFLIWVVNFELVFPGICRLNTHSLLGILPENNLEQLVKVEHKCRAGCRISILFNQLCNQKASHRRTAAIRKYGSMKLIVSLYKYCLGVKHFIRRSTFSPDIFLAIIPCDHTYFQIKIKVS